MTLAPTPMVHKGQSDRRNVLGWRYSRRTVILIALALVAVAGVSAWALTLGAVRIPLEQVPEATFGYGDPTRTQVFVVRTVRLPRVLAAALIGAGLAASGAIFQALVRNPLASPDIIGVNAGAALAAVFLIVVAGSASLVPVGAFVGAVLAAFGVYSGTWRRGIDNVRLILVGIGVTAMLGALTTLMLVRYPVEQTAPALLWTIGTLIQMDWPRTVSVALGVAILLPVALWLTRQLTVLQLGDHVAGSLGIRAERTRAALITVGAGLAAVAVATGGPLGFVALVGPHIARRLAGPLTAGVLLLSALIGAFMVGAADLVAQHAFPVSVPVGVVTAAVGAPFFLVLLYRANRGS